MYIKHIKNTFLNIFSFRKILLNFLLSIKHTNIMLYTKIASPLPHKYTENDIVASNSKNMRTIFIAIFSIGQNDVYTRGGNYLRRTSQTAIKLIIFSMCIACLVVQHGHQARLICNTSPTVLYTHCERYPNVFIYTCE